MRLLRPPHHALPLLKACAHLGFYGIATAIRQAELLDPSPHASLISQELRDSSSQSPWKQHEHWSSTESQLCVSRTHFPQDEAREGSRDGTPL